MQRSWQLSRQIRTDHICTCQIGVATCWRHFHSRFETSAILMIGRTLRTVLITLGMHLDIFWLNSCSLALLPGASLECTKEGAVR